MFKTLTFLVLIAILGLSSCKKDKETSDPAYCSSDWVTTVEVQFDALFAAWSAYTADMSVENCNAYKQAYMDYIDSLEPFLECASWSAAELEELQDVINESESNMNELVCE
jgi:hypothetical protein